MNKGLIIVFYALLCAGCLGNSQHREVNHEDTIFVMYHTYIYETSIAEKCRDLSEFAKSLDIFQTISLEQDTFDSIESFINRHKEKANNNYCEARIHVQMGEVEFCLGDMDCICDIDDNDINASTWYNYLIKWKSGYYNSLDKDNLQWNPLIEYYGIPKDYVHEEIAHEGLMLDDSIEDDDSHIRKVALVREQ